MNSAINSYSRVYKNLGVILLCFTGLCIYLIYFAYNKTNNIFEITMFFCAFPSVISFVVGINYLSKSETINKFFKGSEILASWRYTPSDLEMFPELKKAKQSLIKSMGSYVHEVFITKFGVFFNGNVVTWGQTSLKSIDNRLVDVKFEKDQISYLVFTYTYIYMHRKNRIEKRTDVVKIPVPENEISNAMQIVDFFKAEIMAYEGTGPKTAGIAIEIPQKTPQKKITPKNIYTVIFLIIALMLFSPFFNLLKYFFFKSTNSNPETFFKAVKKGDIRLVEKGFRANPDLLMFKDNEGLTPLLVAFKSKRFQVAEYLIDKCSHIADKGADIYVKDKEGHDCIYYATLNNDKKMMGLIKYYQPHFEGNILAKFDYLDNIAKSEFEKINLFIKEYPQFIDSKENNSGETGLMIAARNNLPEVVKYLVEKGANVNSLSSSGEVTPLICAIKGRGLEVVNYLLNNGAKANFQVNNGLTAMYIAVDNPKYKEIIELLLSKGADINAMSDYGSPLNVAIERGNVTKTKFLLDKGANINIIDRRGNTPLFKALESQNSLKMLEFLLSKGADVNAKTPEGQTPLLSINCKEPEGKEKALLLIKKGADVNYKTSAGLSVLHKAISYEDFEKVRLLIENGANINVKDNKGITPLYLADDLGYMDIATLLMEKGAKPISDDVQIEESTDNKKIEDEFFNFVNSSDLKKVRKIVNESPYIINFRNKDGLTALHIAAQTGNNELIESLLYKYPPNNEFIENLCLSDESTGFNVNGLIVCAIDAGHLDTAKLLISKCNLSYEPHKSMVFAEAVKACNIDMLGFLIEKGVDVNKGYIGKSNLPPIIYAVTLNKPDLIKYLVSHGAGIYITSAMGTPLHYAAAKGFTEIVTILLEEGAYINAKNARGQTPRDLASAYNQKEMLTILDKYVADYYKKN